MRVEVHHADSREKLTTLADASVDSVVCDPPYALVSITKRFGKKGAAPAKAGKTGAYQRASAGFMGKAWDTGEAAFDPDFWAEIMRVLKPGAHVVAFSGTRTYHRLACAIEDAGFEIRDQLAWAYGSGFPKSHNQSGEWQGWGSALKPAWEPICLARKPMIGTIAANLASFGTGALNIDVSRIAHRDAIHRPSEKGTMCGEGDGWSRPWQADQVARGARAERAEASIQKAEASGRWPANIIHDGSDEVLEAFQDSPGQQRAVTGDERSHRTLNAYGDFGSTRDGFEPRGDAGSAARFFYTAKADAEDRMGSKHPTVKPISLMAWLCRLVTPPGGVVLDPFAGTGTTGLAAMREGFSAILIEREAEYVADIERRLAWARGEGRLTAQEKSRHQTKPVDGLPLFGDAA